MRERLPPEEEVEFGRTLLARVWIKLALGDSLLNAVSRWLRKFHGGSLPSVDDSASVISGFLKRSVSVGVLAFLCLYLLPNLIAALQFVALREQTQEIRLQTDKEFQAIMDQSGAIQNQTDVQQAASMASLRASYISELYKKENLRDGNGNCQELKEVRKQAEFAKAFVSLERVSNKGKKEMVRPDLSNVNLSRAELNGFNWTGVVFDGACLDDADFTGSNLSNASLNSIDGRRIKFARATLTDASFLEAILAEGNFVAGILDGANFIGADLSGASLVFSSFLRTKLGETDLSNAFLELSRLPHDYPRFEQLSQHLKEAGLAPAYDIFTKDFKIPSESIPFSALRGLSEELIAPSMGNCKTTLPASIRRPAHWIPREGCAE